MTAVGPTAPLLGDELCHIAVHQLPVRLLSHQAVLQFFSVCGEVKLVQLDEAQKTATFLASRSVAAKCCLLSGLEVQGSSLIVTTQPISQTPVPVAVPSPSPAPETPAPPAQKHIYTVSPDDQVVKFPVPADLESLKRAIGQAFGGRVFELRTGLMPLRTSADLAGLAKSTWVVAAYELNPADQGPEAETAAVSDSLHHSLHAFASLHSPGPQPTTPSFSPTPATPSLNPTPTFDALDSPIVPTANTTSSPPPSPSRPPALSSSPPSPYTLFTPASADQWGQVQSLGDCLLIENAPALLASLPAYRADLPQGYLALQPLGFRHSHWSYRYCVLLPDGLVRLRFEASPGGPVALVKGVIELRHIAEVEALPSAFHLFLTDESPSPNKQFMLVAASSTDLATW